MAAFLLIWLLIAIVAFVSFVFLNPGITIQTFTLGFKDFHNVSLSLIVFSSFVVGFVYSLIIGVVQEFRLRARIRKLKNMQESLLEELDALRKAPIEKFPTEEEEEEDVS